MRLPLAVVASAALFVGFAAPAQAGEAISFDQQYINSSCTKGPVDQDCYHDAGTYSTHQGCENKIAALGGVDPTTDAGKLFIINSTYYCPSTPPVGYYHLSMFQSSPACAFGLPFSQCPKG